MKQLKSSLGDLRRLFARTVSIRDIAEPLISFDHSQECAPVRRLMEEKEYDVVGIRTHGVVSGYVRRDELWDTGTLESHGHRFASGDILPDTEPLLSVFAALRTRRHVFVTVLGSVGGIVTRGDLQKAPVRLWLFGLVSLLEMQLLRVVRERFPLEEWAALLSEDRVDGARRLHEERRRRNEASDLSDCLQLGDKATVLMKDPQLFSASGFRSRASLQDFFKEVGALRNALAHANDILSGRWPALADLVTRMESLLERLEVMVPTPSVVKRERVPRM